MKYCFGKLKSIWSMYALHSSMQLKSNSVVPSNKQMYIGTDIRLIVWWCALCVFRGWKYTVQTSFFFLCSSSQETLKAFATDSKNPILFAQKFIASADGKCNKFIHLTLSDLFCCVNCVCSTLVCLPLFVCLDGDILTSDLLQAHQQLLALHYK